MFHATCLPSNVLLSYLYSPIERWDLCHFPLNLGNPYNCLYQHNVFILCLSLSLPPRSSLSLHFLHSGKAELPWSCHAAKTSHKEMSEDPQLPWAPSSSSLPSPGTGLVNEEVWEMIPAPVTIRLQAHEKPWVRSIQSNIPPFLPKEIIIDNNDYWFKPLSVGVERSATSGVQVLGMGSKKNMQESY